MTRRANLQQWFEEDKCAGGSGELYKRSWNSWFRLMSFKKNDIFSNTNNNIVFEKFQFDSVYLPCFNSVCVKNCLSQGKKTLFLKEETRSRSSYLGMLVNYLRGSK